MQEKDVLNHDISFKDIRESRYYYNLSKVEDFSTRYWGHHARTLRNHVHGRLDEYCDNVDVLNWSTAL